MVDPLLITVIQELMKTNTAQNELILRYATALTRGQVVSYPTNPLPQEITHATTEFPDRDTGRTSSAEQPVIEPDIGPDVWSDTGP